MKKCLLISLMIYCTQLLNAQIPAYKWAYSIGDVGQENLNSLVVDSENNVIIAGEMYSTTDMDPTEFLKILTQIGQQDGFMEKFDPDGNVMWALNFGGAYYDAITKIAVDALDNIYVIGYYKNVIDLNPNMVDQDLTVLHGGYDMFISKFDKNGEFIWGHGIGGLEDDWINSIAFDDFGNLYIAGQFKGTVDFDGTEEVLEINATFDYYDGFLAKYNLDGDIEWVFRIGGSDEDIANEIAVDNAGNIVVTGTFQGSVNFGAGFLEAADGTMVGWPKEGDAYIAKYNSNSDLIWAKSIVGDNDFNGGYSNMVYALATDSYDNIYVTGLIYGEGDFNMGDDDSIITTFDSYDSYFAKYDTNGDFKWAHTTAPKVFGFNLDMAVDVNDDIYLTGDYNYSAGAPYEADFDFDPDTVYALQAKGEKDVYLAKYDGDAELIWAFTIGGEGWEFSTAINLDDDLNIYAGGWFYSSDDFDANPDSNFIWLPYIDPNYGDNIWLGKYDQDVIIENPDAIFEVASDQPMIYPNPAINSICILNADKNEFSQQVEIFNMHGALIKTLEAASQMDISDLPKGLYYLKTETFIARFIKI